MRRSARAAAALALALLGGCAEGPRPPSLLLVTIDTLRADACDVPGLARGRAVAATPRLAQLAASGTTFTAASSVAPLTLPAHASLMTGLRPARHGLTVNGVARERLPSPTLAEVLGRAGRATGAFVSSTVLDRRYGLAAGFDVYDDVLFEPGGPPAPTERRGDRTADRALAWLRERDGPFLGWVHLFDPHAPYDAPDAPRGRDREAYLAEVAFADRQLGRLLDALEPARTGPVLVVVTADHGEGLGEHGERTHGLLLHEATIRVPLVVGWVGTAPPGAPFAGAPTRRDDAVSLVDLAPTLLAALGEAAPSGLDGADVVTPRPGRALPLEARAAWVYYAHAPLAGVRRDALKLVGAPRAEPPGWTLYDLAEDPDELAGAAAAGHELVGAVRSPEPAREADPVATGVFAELGYLGASAPPEAQGPLPDPRAAVEMLGALDEANTRLVGGDPAGARRLAEQVLEHWGAMPEARYLLGRALREQAARTEDAAWAEDLLARATAVLEQAARARPRNADLLVELGLARLQRARATGGDHGAAIRDLDAALALVPGDPRASAWRALADLEAGRAEAALTRLDDLAARRGAATDPTVLRVRLAVLRALGRTREADRVAARLDAWGLLDG